MKKILILRQVNQSKIFINFKIDKKIDWKKLEHYAKSFKIMKKRFDQELNRIKTNVLASKTKIYGEANDEFKDRIELKTESKTR